MTETILAAGSQIDVPTIKVLWIHNSPKTQRMFLWDLREALPASVAVTEIFLPLRPTPRTMLAVLRHIRSAAQDHDLVHAQFGSLVGFLASFASRPNILSLRGTDFYILPTRTTKGWLEAHMRQFLTYIACLRARQIVVMSHRMRRDLRRWPFLSRKSISVIVDPVGQEFVEKVQVELTQARTFKIFVGSAVADNAVKRTWLIDQAVALCHNVGLPVKLNIVSGVPRSDVQKAMTESDLLVLASTHEGWPNIVKEGIACGLPFLTTDVSDLDALCGPGTPNRIVEPDVLDVALNIADAVARRDSASALADVIPSVVGFKHLLLYAHAAESDR